MTTASAISKIVTLHLRLYHKERYSLWMVFPVVALIGLARFFDGRGVLPQQTLMPLIVVMTIMVNDRFIIDPCSNIDNELTKLFLLPLNARDIILAKYAASFMIVTGSCFVVITTALILLNLSLAQAAEAMMFVVSTLIPMFILGSVFARPMHVNTGVPILFTTFSSAVFGISSIPYIVTKVIVGSDLLCLAWIAVSSVWAAYLASSVSEQWLMDRKFRRDAS